MSAKSVRPYLKSKDQLLNIEWGISNKWDVRILDNDAPSIFRSFFPATDVTEPVFDLEEHTFNIGYASLNVISGYKVPKLSMTFYDDHNGTLERYLEKWTNQNILGGLTSVLPIESCLKSIEVYRYNNFGKKIWNTIYKVCPSGELSRENTSDPKFISLKVDFIIGSLTRNY